MSAEKQAARRGWFWVVEPDGGAHAPPERRVVAEDGTVLTRRLQGSSARVEVRDRVGLSVATRLRAASAVGLALEDQGGDHAVAVELIPSSWPRATGPGIPSSWPRASSPGCLQVDGEWVAAQPSHHPVEALARELVASGIPGAGRARRPAPRKAAPRVLFFESLMNSDMPHNDRELSQGVLHLASALAGTDAEIVMANVKMPITGVERPIWGLESLDAALAEPVHLVVITLLEGYFEGVQRLISALRARGCRAHVAVGGVMPTLSPEHVAAHLEGVTFVCRGAGEPLLPALIEIAGAGSIDEPFTEAQRAAFLELSGLIVVEADGLLSCDVATVNEVDSLDAIAVDLRHLLPRHIEGGIEISTSRGCIHRCTFCSIIGRESYQARTAEGVFSLLERYEARFRELFGDDVPPNAYRVHISDDDFACDKPRAAAFLRELGQTRFRLSSVQASVADLCRRDGGKLVPEPDPLLFDVLRPELFADHARPAPERDYVADHKTRRWSSYLQIGVETFCDAELVRLGKGYRRVHVRAVAAALNAKQIHFDAYFIQSNAETSATDLLESTLELCRMKLRFSRHFHLRFPVVPHLVSYFPSASHRHKVRAGKRETMAIRALGRVPGHPELDYPFVDHDLPGDAWVALAVDRGFLTDDGYYTGSLGRLRDLWLARWRELPAGPERRQGELLLRRLDDAPRRLAFDLLSRARASARGAPDGDWPGPAPSEAHALQVATALLGEPKRWLKTWRRWDSEEVPRLVVIPTWQCELRCRYCLIPKQDGRVMTVETLERSIDLLLSSDREDLILQFFGGEALLEWGLVQHAVRYGSERAEAAGKRLTFVLSSNGWSLDAAKLAWLKPYPVKLELSLDGDRDTQNRFRRAFRKGEDSYDAGIAPRAADILASGLRYDVIMVVHPQNVDKMPANFFHIASLGFRRIQINFTLGAMWSPAQQQSYAHGLHEIAGRLAAQDTEDPVVMVNLENRPMPMRLNGEITVDWDGTVYGGNAFLHETEHKPKFALGHLDDGAAFDRYWLDGPENDQLVAWSYPPEVTRNNLEVGRIMTSWLQWMQRTPA